ncbi:hypothetical protein CRENBAI_016149 [Crenichthys baileyi]|uniref:Uncharacterized protein n=1 Tax=Crenichthys baileyi TaxID=28760 RepID=A0AAV9QZ59_9TELE
MNPRSSSQSATENLTEPPTSSTESRRVGPLAKNSSRTVSFLSPLTTATPDPADMFVAGQLNRSPTNFDELLPSTSRSETRNYLDGAGDFRRKEASHIQPKSGAAFKRLFKSQQVVHQQKVTVSEPPDESEPTSADKKGQPEKGLLKWIFTKLKPRRKPFKSAQKHYQEAEPEPDVETEQTDPKSVHIPLDPSSVWPSILDHGEEFDYKSVSTLAFSIPSKEEQKSSLASSFTEETSFDKIEALSVDADDWISTFAAVEKRSSDTEETAETREQEKYGSCQIKDSNQTGNTVMEDKLLDPLESHVGSVETLKGITKTPGSYRIIQLKKDIFFFDMDSSENKQQSNADPVVGADKSYISGDTDTESMLPSFRISAKSAVTDEQSENTQDEDQDVERDESKEFLTVSH